LPLVFAAGLEGSAATRHTSFLGVSFFLTAIFFLGGLATWTDSCSFSGAITVALPVASVLAVLGARNTVWRGTGSLDPVPDLHEVNKQSQSSTNEMKKMK